MEEGERGRGNFNYSPAGESNEQANSLLLSLPLSVGDLSEKEPGKKENGSDLSEEIAKLCFGAAAERKGKNCAAEKEKKVFVVLVVEHLEYLLQRPETKGELGERESKGFFCSLFPPIL